MNDQFLKRFLNFAFEVTRAERGFSVNNQLQLVDKINAEESFVTQDGFVGKLLKQALDTSQPILTNNMITDPSQAPTTNTNFSNLRVVVVLPIPNHGIIYLDQKIKTGIFTREVLRKLQGTLEKITVDQQANISEAEMREIYEKV